MLRDAGAIPFVRGNVPQQLMMPMTSNAIWGTALNPWDFARTPGGSSGGDAALVAVGAAPISIGTDIGGSIRIPCSNTGVFGFKPTPQRMTHHGMPAPRPGNSAGQEDIVPTAGPLARCVSDLVTVMRVLWQPVDNKMFARDPYVVPMPFDETQLAADKPLRIGYYVHDGWMDAAPSYVGTHYTFLSPSL
jgi:Asp-tRNA(Asn)/Glu-tRNA(Gln) amidotransferase A subunit family amidase